jgi:hypothetical protein
MGRAFRRALAMVGADLRADLGVHHLAADQRDRVAQQVAMLAAHQLGDDIGISQLKRGYGLRRSRLKRPRRCPHPVGWAILAYNLDTLAIRAA